jgi:hypothetical protein
MPTLMWQAPNFLLWKPIYTFPNLNLALFGENIFKISSNFSITPGFRFEKYEHKRKAIIEKSIKT